MNEVKSDIKELKAIVSDLEPKNANRHLEIEQDLTEIKSNLKN